jgi:hypothetical protein
MLLFIGIVGFMRDTSMLVGRETTIVLTERLPHMAIQEWDDCSGR